MKCPKCRHVNQAGATQCDDCGVILADAKRGSERGSVSLAGQVCAWNDHGHRCHWRGVFSTTTVGGGQWYCREHWESINGRHPAGPGNHEVESTRSVAMRAWDGWYDRWIERRKPGKRFTQREPGDDDEVAA